MKKTLLKSLFFQISISFSDYLKSLKKSAGGQKVQLCVLLIFFYSSLWAQPPHTYTSDNTLFVPAGVTSMDIEGWGAGGWGGEASGATVDGRSGGGGGGGAYAKGKITVVPGVTLNIRVAGIPASGASGGNSTILGFEGVFLAAGGKAGTPNNSGGIPAGGKGGLAADSFGSITKTSGVNGGDGSTGLIGLLQGSGAGGKGGDTGGGAGGAGITSIALGNAPGKPGSPPGGGGSGAMNSLFGALQAGGAGAAGQIKLNYICPSYGITGVSASPVCSTLGNTTITLTGSQTSLPVGVYTVTYNLTNPVNNGLTVEMTVSAAGSGSFELSGFSTAGSRNITITKLTSGACFADISSNNTASIVISSPSVGGTVGGGTTICSGSTSGVLTLAGNTGTVLNWESSVSPFSVWTPIVNTASTYTSGALTQTTQFRAVVQNGACSSISSVATTVTVNQIPTPTFTVQPGASICINTDVTYTTQSGQTNYIWSVPGTAGNDYNIILGDLSSSSSTVTLQWLSTGNKTVSVQYSSNGCPAVTSATNTTAVIKTERGVVNGGLHICQGNPSPLLTFNNYVGTIVRWEYATTTPYVWQPISYTGITYQPGILTESTSYRAVVKNGTCPEEFAIETRIDVDPVPSAPNILSFTQPNCTTPTGSITLNGLSGSGNILQSDGSVITPRAYSGTSLTISGLPLGKYKFAIENNCSITYSAEITIQHNIWNGSSWSYGTADPSLDDILDFQEDYDLDKNINACSLTINNDAIVTIQHGKTLNVVKGVHVDQGSLIFEDGASLLQTSSDNNLNTGKIIYKRSTFPIRRADYVYWSTPVSPQAIIDVSPLTKTDKLYSNNGDNWVSEAPSKIMVPGKGYIIRGPETFSNTIRSNFTALFIGVPNNGTITGENVVAEKFFLIGNPYPSALNADDFININSPILEGTLYFWTHNTPVVLGGAYQYGSDDYATYNLTGGVGTAAGSGDDALGNNNNPPSGNIAAGQSFFAGIATSGTIVFNNSMRRGGAANTQFFKTDQTFKSSAIEKNRIWLNMTNTEGAFKQLLVGYIEGATDEYDRKYDGNSFDGNKYLDFYSINNDHKLVIQGRAIPFKNTDAVPLGYRTTIAGEFTISIYHVDGSLTLMPIYLEDKITNKIHDLRAGNYTFNTEAGTFSDRFVLRYTNKSLGIDDVSNVENNVWVSVKLKDMKVISNRESIQEVAVFDLSGRLLYEKKNINATELQLLNFRSESQVLLVKVTLENGNTTTKKIIF
ncbi:T9SS sorting signal type C domain-containing protein [Flavobacterium sp. LC2016-01]|uniref:T9SS sorting signal type C domain-containing protein n=1 Tax=Flavobacterium sp. LC2016-01 TaxID=2675876 RepID=UPI0012BABDE6|nr:T9SS sorting signal type C domain-containing protein [Flavobacterium sp. LC2016-01]MTH17123.1 T9SS sorting signal type C domain-containing protein [Flavobacterium sp. LC2016-01]